MSPANIAARAGERVTDLRSLAADFVQEFRRAAAEREAELRAQLEE
jgi:hypothetical protein